MMVGRDAATREYAEQRTPMFPGGTWVKPSGALRPRLVQRPYKAISRRLPRGALLGAGCIPHDVTLGQCVWLAPVTPGPLWRNRGHASSARHPLAFGGRKTRGIRADPRARR